MKRFAFIISAFCAFCSTAMAQDATVTINTSQPGSKINKEIYGQFSEHLGSCIYGGLWVGEDSNIPNINGYRKDVFEALKDLSIPVLRWPGGCFADDYHWRDGIGPRNQRPSLRNNNWGGTMEDNSFGTHEFLNLCEMLGCEPYISGNVGSGTVEEMVKWVEYMNSEDGTPMAELRKKNGREHAWNVKYFGIGNEAWGCGGNMRPEYYTDLFRQYSTYLRDYDPAHPLYIIASGSNAGDYNWTDVYMKNTNGRAKGLSFHYYTVKDWNNHGSATNFDARSYYNTLALCREIEPIIKGHCEVMDKYDPEKKVGLMADEWGTWWDEEPGTIKGHLYQQNTMRDAMVGALSLNIFHQYTDRLRMANIAQVVNVLQSMILTDQKGTGHMVLTPTYYLFKMYKPFQEATNCPVTVNCTIKDVQKDDDKPETLPLPTISCSAAKTTTGSLAVALANVELEKKQNVEVDLGGYKAKSVTGTILTAKKVGDFNDFDHPETIKTVEFKGAKLKGGKLSVALPAMSIVVLDVK